MRGSRAVRALILLWGWALAGCSTGTTPPPPAPSSPPISTSVSTSTTTPTSPADAFVCANPTVGPLPEWARSGFSPPDQPVGHLQAVGGHVVAVPFGWPLREKQLKGRENKVLWVADMSTGGPLVIQARRESDTEVVRREVPNGPGPSIIDLPAKGCWQLDLSWPGGTDRVYLRYFGPGA